MSAFERRAWRTVKLGEVCNEITVGFVGKMANEYVDEGVPFLRSQDVLPFRVDTANLKNISPAFHSRIQKSRLQPGDVVVVRTGYPGTASVIPPELADANCADLVIVRPSKHLNPHFASCLFNSHVGRAAISGVLVGAAQQHFNVGAAKAMRVLLPPISEQNRIAAILSAYDDLIEANRRRVAILEEMARRLFEEWFVHLRFPGHVTTPLHDTPDGPVPEGWRYLPLAAVANVNQASIRPNVALDEIRYVDIASVSPGRIEHVQSYMFTDAPGRARRLVRDGSIIWSTVRPNRRSFALMLDPEPDLVVSTGFAVLDAHLVPASYLYAWTTTDAFVSYLVNHATGSAYPAVTGATFERAQVLVPTTAITDAYDDLAAPMLRLADKLNRANVRLTAARNLLLPRLLSGQLSVAQDHAPVLLAAE